MTDNWLNIRWSLEKIFCDFLAKTAKDVPFFRFAPPSEPEQQRALVSDRALFVQLVKGDTNRNQDTYAVVYLLKTWDKSKYVPTLAQDVWLQSFAGELMEYLDYGKARSAHLFPLYNVVAALPAGAYQAFLETGDSGEIELHLPESPRVIKNTGFYMRAGHTQPKTTVTRNPMGWEMSVIFQHYNYDVWQGTRG